MDKCLDTILSSQVCFHRISQHTWSLVSLVALWRLAASSVTLEFSLQTRKKAFRNFFSESYQRKKLSNQTPTCARTGTIMLCLYYYLLLISFYIFTFLFTFLSISHVWEVNNTTWVKPMNWNCSETVWNFIKTLWRKIVETQETHEAVPTSIRRRLTLVNSCFYDDILDISWSVPKMPSYKETFFILQNLIVLSTVMFENFFGKNWCTETFQRVTFTIFKTSLLLTVSDTLYSPCAL